MPNADTTANLLIVDDLPENLLALNALIRQEGRTVFQASCGEDALNLLLEHEFALAILDVQMPGMNGFELAELMRGTEKTRHIPIVFVTAAGKESNYAFKGYESGAVDFLVQAAGHRTPSRARSMCSSSFTGSAMKSAARSRRSKKTGRSRTRCCSSCKPPSMNCKRRCACATISCRSWRMSC